jgi:hypothetical protein
VPRDKTASAGVIAIETKVALVTMTVSLAVEEMLPDLAEIVESPGDNPLAKPVMSPTLMLATATFPEVQLTDEVISCWVPSLKAPIALNCAVWPEKIDIADGEITIETKAAATTVIEPCPTTPDSVAVTVAEPGA